MLAAHYGNSPGEAFGSFQAYNEARARELQNAFQMLQRRNEFAAQQELANRQLQYRNQEVATRDAMAEREFQARLQDAAAERAFRQRQFEEGTLRQNQAQREYWEAQQAQRALPPATPAATRKYWIDEARRNGMRMPGTPQDVWEEADAAAMSSRPVLQSDWDERRGLAETGNRALKITQKAKEPLPAPTEAPDDRPWYSRYTPLGWATRELANLIYGGMRSPDTSWRTAGATRMQPQIAAADAAVKDERIFRAPGSRAYDPGPPPLFIQQPSAAGVSDGTYLDEMIDLDPRQFRMMSSGQTGAGYVPPAMGTNRMLNYGGQLPPNVVMPPGSSNVMMNAPTLNPYVPGRRYGNLRYIGGDPLDERSWQPVAVGVQ